MIGFSVETKQALRFTATVLRQFDYTTSRALNDMAYGSQRRVRGGLPGKFTLRGSQAFMERLVKVTREDRASRDRLMSAVRIEGPERSLRRGNDRGRILSRHERGGAKEQPQSNPFFIPSDYLRAGGGRIPRNLYPANLRLAPRRNVTGLLQRKERVTGRGVLQFPGKRRTFILDPAYHRTNFWGIYQRTGPERGDVQLLWLLRTQLEIEPRLNFVQDVHTYVRANWSTSWHRRFAEALGVRKGAR